MNLGMDTQLDTTVAPESGTSVTVEAFESEADAYELLERLRWGDDGPTQCPHCGSDKGAWFLKPKDPNGRLAKGGSTSRSQRRVWKCRENSCRRQFSALTNTVMHATKMPVRVWVGAILDLCRAENGVSARDISARWNVTEKSAWTMLTRIEEAISRAAPTADQMSSSAVQWIELPDETGIVGAPEPAQTPVHPVPIQANRSPLVPRVEPPDAVQTTPSPPPETVVVPVVESAAAQVKSDVERALAEAFAEPTATPAVTPATTPPARPSPRAGGWSEKPNKRRESRRDQPRVEAEREPRPAKPRSDDDERRPRGLDKERPDRKKRSAKGWSEKPKKGRKPRPAKKRAAAADGPRRAKDRGDRTPSAATAELPQPVDNSRTSQPEGGKNGPGARPANPSPPPLIADAPKLSAGSQTGADELGGGWLRAAASSPLDTGHGVSQEQGRLVGIDGAALGPAWAQNDLPTPSKRDTSPDLPPDQLDLFSGDNNLGF